MKDKLPIILFLFSLITVVFFYGFFVGYQDTRWTPYWTMHTTYIKVKDSLLHWKNEFSIEPTRLLVPRNSNKSMITVNDSVRSASGYRIISRMNSKLPSLHELIVYDENWNELHSLPINYEKINPAGVEKQNTHLHGLDVTPDGSFVLNFDAGNVLVKIGMCGNILWRNVGNYHHAVTRSYDGTIWTLNNQGFVQLDPKTGEKLKSVSIKKDVILRHKLQGLFGMRTKEISNEFVFMEDPLHLNDIEVLSPDMSKAFPGFTPGDILLSFREINLVIVLDKDDYHAKWWSHGPWHRQHDPDFVADGSISVYDNNMGFNASRIVKVRPGTTDYETVYEGNDKSPFYSWRMGKHQYLTNGNLLIVEPEHGRVFEVDSKGDILWEYNNIYDETRNGMIYNSIVIPLDYFDKEVFKCWTMAKGISR